MVWQILFLSTEKLYIFFFYINCISRHFFQSVLYSSSHILFVTRNNKSFLSLLFFSLAATNLAWLLFLRGSHVGLVCFVKLAWLDQLQWQCSLDMFPLSVSDWERLKLCGCQKYARQLPSNGVNGPRSQFKLKAALHMCTCLQPQAQCSVTTLCNSDFPETLVIWPSQGKVWPQSALLYTATAGPHGLHVAPTDELPYAADIALI